MSFTEQIEGKSTYLIPVLLIIRSFCLESMNSHLNFHLPIKCNLFGVLLLVTGVTNMETEKTRTNPVVLSWFWRYEYELMVFNTCLAKNGSKHRCKYMCTHGLTNIHPELYPSVDLEGETTQ